MNAEEKQTAAAARVAETRLRVKQRIGEMKRAASEDVRHTLAVKDAFLAVVGVVGVLFAARQLGKALGGKCRDADAKVTRRSRETTRVSRRRDA